jgi:steroid 5-alpha reductase family enzyme
MILIPATLFLCAVMALAWVAQRRIGNAGLVDAFWTFGLGAAGAGVALLAGTGQRRFIVASLVGVWAIRLGSHILFRIRGAWEDSRYARLREEWGAGFQRRLFGFLQIQAAAAALLLVPILLAAMSPRPLGWIDVLAMAIALLAFLGEGVADRQLQAFRSDPLNHGRVCDTGLWAWSRHPNYVFEWLHWWAYPLLALGASWAALALVGPVFMYWLLVHVSGIPPLEAEMLRSRGAAYRAYQQRVSAFLPWPKGLIR